MGWIEAGGLGVGPGCVPSCHVLPTPHTPNSHTQTHTQPPQTPQHVVWRAITDYDNLANILPNLSVSRRLPLPPDGPYPNATGRIYQEGEQRLFGWKVPMLISAGVVLDFEEDEAAGTVKAYLVESAMLLEYHAEWRLVEEKLGGAVVTRMYYSGVACPKGPVPQRLVEWQLRRDVPMNLRSLKAYAEAFGDGLNGEGDGDGGMESPARTEDLEEEDDGEDGEGEESFVLAAEEEGEEAEEEMKDAFADVDLGDEDENEKGEGGACENGSGSGNADKGVQTETEQLAPAPVCCLPVVRRLKSRD